MAKNLKLSVEKRTLTGRKVKRLRRENNIPANIFGKKVKSLAVQVKNSDIVKVYQEAGETSLIDLSVDQDKQVRPVLISNVHKDPVTDDFLHVDFHQVDLTKKVSATISLELIGESPAVKEQSAVINSAFLEVEVEALPADLPEKIEIDISTLKEIGNSIFVKDIKISDKISILLEPGTLLVSVIEPKEEEEEPAPAEAEAETDAEEGTDEAETDESSEEAPKEAEKESSKKETHSEDKSKKE